MQIELVTWKIRGTRPLMQSNAVNLMTRKDSDDVSTGKGKRLDAKAEAKLQLYESDGKFWHPSMSFWRAVVVIAPNRQLGGKAVSGIWPQAVSITEEEFWLFDPDTLDSKSPKPLTDKQWVYDVRRVPAGGAKGAILTSRPKWKKWGGFLTMEVDREYVPTSKDPNKDPLTILLNIAGRLGIGSGRMRRDEKKGWGGLNLGKFEAELK